MKMPFFSLPKKTLFHSVIFITIAASWVKAEKIIVSNASQLENAVVNAQQGDTVEVLNGIYNTEGSITMYNSGTTTAPIVIRAAERLMAELTGETYFDLRQCAYIIIEGFLFTSVDVTAIKLEACNNIRITRNLFRLGETSSLKWVIIQGIWNNPNAMSHHNRIDYNLFENKHLPGNFITVDGSGDPVYQSSQHDVIAYNHFRNIGPRHPNEMEAVRVGWSELSFSSGFTTVEYNLFEDCDSDPEIVSVKTNDNLVRYNTFVRCQGTLSLRHGNRTTVEGNFFIGENKSGTGGVRIYGDDHIIFNNYFTELTGSNWDSPITLTNGDYDGGGNLTAHWRINRAVIIYNTLVNNRHNIEIGFTNNGAYTKPPRDVVMANNLVWGKTNELIKEITAPVNMTWLSNLMFPDSIATLGIPVQPGQIKITNPQMDYIDSLWQIKAISPALDSAYNNYPYVIDDFTGQTRDSQPDIGADEYSTETWLRKPLKAEDVGPGAPVIPTGLKKIYPKNLQADFKLHGIYPNPFNPSTTIEFFIVKKTSVMIRVYDLLGREVATLMNDKILKPGLFRQEFDARHLPAGIYFYHIEAGKIIRTGKLTLLK